MIFKKKIRWLSAILLLAILIVLFVKGNTQYDQINNQVLHSVDEVLHYNASLNSHVLMSRSGILHQYDVVNQDIDNMRLSLKELATNLDKLPDDLSINLKQLNSKLKQAVNDAETFYDVIQLEYPHTVRMINQMKKYGRKVGYTFVECLSKSFTSYNVA